MAETLLAIVLVTTSAKGANLVFRWPPFPETAPRLCRPKPDDQVFISQLDNPWRASLSHQGSFIGTSKETFKSGNLGNVTGTVERDSPIIDPALLQGEECDYSRHPEYCWQRPGTLSTPGTTQKKPNYDHDYEHMLGYSCEFLATLLCPQRSMCHQRFELVVDDLVFIGHPVASEEEEKGGGCSWRFKAEKPKTSSRGRDHKERASTYDANSSYPPSQAQSLAASPEKMTALERSGSPSRTSAAWLNRFQLALVLDLPDPSSSASGNVSKYFDAIYEQIAFTFAAVLFQEQVLENFVEKECDALIALQESLFKKEEPYENYVNQALQASSIASAMKAVYEGIKTRSVAYLSLNAIPLELQLPPHLDDLLRAQDDYDIDFIERPGDEEMQNWGPELSFGWKLPGLAPWKSLLLLDGESDIEDPLGSLRDANNSVNVEERAMAESLLRFLETASITLSLADMGSLLDWDLEAQVYPVVRWLVLHRRAKVVDTVNISLKTIFALPSKLSAPLPKLAEEFRIQFSSEVPPLPRILAMISSSLAKQSDNHFFASVVKQKELIPLYHDIVVWMLKRDLLVTLHLRIRIIATRELKKRASDSRKAALANRAAKLHQKKLAVQERELALRGRDGRKPLHIPSSMNIQRRRSSNKSGGTSSLHGGHHSDIEEFDEFDEREEEDGFAPSSSSKTPSGLTAFMSLSPPKARGSSSGSVVSGSIAQRRGLVVPAPSSMSRRLSSTESRGTAISELVIREEEVDEDSSFGGRMAMFGDEEPPSATASSHSISAYRDLDEIPYGYGYYDAGDGLLGGEMEPEEEEEEETDYGPTDSSEEEDGSGATLINDPGRATPMQRRWLTAMSDGVEVHIAKRFEQINQYFDGKKSDDEILFRAEITRRQLREVLHHYEPYLQTFLHPS